MMATMLTEDQVAEIRERFDRIDARNPEGCYALLTRVYGGMDAGTIYNRFFLRDVAWATENRDASERLSQIGRDLVYVDAGVYGRAERSDIHRPSAIDPADYEYVGAVVKEPPVDYETGEIMIDEDMTLWFRPFGDDRDYRDLLDPKTSPDRPRDDIAQCDHCGAWFNYGAVYQHTPSGQFIIVGHDCADNTMGWSDRRSLELARQKQAMDAARKNLKEQRERTENLEATRSLFPEAVDLLTGYEGRNSFIQDVASRLTRFGSVKIIRSDWNRETQSREIDPELVASQAKVMNAILKAHQRDLARAEEKAAAKDVPEGRFEIEGVVLKVDEKENDFGVRWVMTVKSDDGWVVWGTVPSAIDPDKGDRVKFTGTVEASGRDPKFGFFKRPSKAMIVTAEAGS